MSAEPVSPPQSAQPSQMIAVNAIIPSGLNPRKHFDRDALEDLASSIRKHGVLQAILVRPRKNVPPAAVLKAHYELVAGERRWRASKALGVPMIPAVVRELTDEEVLEIAVIENLQRQDLHPLEEADGYHTLTRAAFGYDVAKIAASVGRSASYVRDRLKLLSLTKAAQQLFREGKILPGHAVILARLSPKDQDRTIDEHGALFEDEHTEVIPGMEREGDDVKARTPRELQAWVNEHVKLTQQEDELPVLFPETVAAVAAAEEAAEKIVHITHNYHVADDAKDDGQRVYGPMSWRRADGSGKDAKACEYSITGVVVVGPERGAAFKVCIQRNTCSKHWSEEMRLAKQRSKAAASGGKTGEDRYAIEQRKRQEQLARDEEQRKRFAKAVPRILEALAAAVKKAPTRAKGQLADMVIKRVLRYGESAAAAEQWVSRGTTSDDLVRHAAFITLCGEIGNGNGYARANATKAAKAFGIDIRKLVDEANQEPKAAAATKKAKKK